MATETPITFTAPPNGALSAGNSGFVWDTDIYGAYLTSWKLSFDFTINTYYQKDNLFNLGSPDGNYAHTGLHLYVKDQGDIAFADGSNPDLFSLEDVFTNKTATNITLQYINDVDEEGTALGTGTFSLTMGGRTYTQTVETESQTAIYGNNTYGRLWTNGKKETFSNITLTKLSDNVVIPEPTTATLSLLALAGLAARRRRK